MDDDPKDRVPVLYGKTAGKAAAHVQLVAGLSEHCLRRSKPTKNPKYCRSMAYGEKEIKSARLRPEKCLEEMLPGVKAEMCSLCEHHNCDKPRKVLERIESNLVKQGSKVVSLLRNTHALQERLSAKYASLEDAFNTHLSKKLRHRLACSKEVQDGKFGPGLCRGELEQILPGQSDLVFSVADINHNKMVTTGELRSFLSTVTLFSHMAAPVVQHGSSLQTMRTFPVMERLHKWLGWENDTSTPSETHDIQA